MVVMSFAAAAGTSISAVSASALPLSAGVTDGGVDAGYLIACNVKVSGSNGVIATSTCEVEQEYEGSNNAPDAGTRAVVIRSLPRGGRPRVAIFFRTFLGAPTIGVQMAFQGFVVFSPEPGVEWTTDTSSPRTIGSMTITLTSVRPVRVDGGKVFHEVHGIVEATAEATRGTASGTVDLRATF